MLYRYQPCNPVLPASPSGICGSAYRGYCAASTWHIWKWWSEEASLHSQSGERSPHTPVALPMSSAMHSAPASSSDLPPAQYKSYMVPDTAWSQYRYSAVYECHPHWSYSASHAAPRLHPDDCHYLSVCRNDTCYKANFPVPHKAASLQKALPASSYPNHVLRLECTHEKPYWRSLRSEYIR